MSEPRRHVLIWVTPEFLKSSGMIRIFTEAGILFPQDEDLNEYIRSAVAAGGFAMTGTLVEAHHGAGIWISPVGLPALELMVPWQFVQSVITAETPQPPKAFGLTRELAVANGTGRKQNEHRKARNSRE
jgi:hypothetical protein